MTRKDLDLLAAKYNSASNRSKDPVKFIYEYRRADDRELAGLIASTLAYGRVETIKKSIANVLYPLGPDLKRSIMDQRMDLTSTYRHFKHRLNKGTDIVLLLLGLRAVLRKHGSLFSLFKSSLETSNGDLRQALELFVCAIRKEVISSSIRFHIPLGYVMHLLPSPSSNSACKRMNLFLKWMLRKDNVDPGVWASRLPGLKSSLVIPLDVHIARNARRNRMTRRKTNDWKTAEEITCFLRGYCPDDPLKYDFAICHNGMDALRRRSRR